MELVKLREAQQHEEEEEREATPREPRKRDALRELRRAEQKLVASYGTARDDPPTDNVRDAISGELDEMEECSRSTAASSLVRSWATCWGSA